jgi:hypothetical protein
MDLMEHKQKIPKLEVSSSCLSQVWDLGFCGFSCVESITLAINGDMDNLSE